MCLPHGVYHTHNSGNTEGLGPQGLTPLYGITWDLLIFALELQFTLVFYAKIPPTNTYSTTGYKRISHRWANELAGLSFDAVRQKALIAKVSKTEEARVRSNQRFSQWNPDGRFILFTCLIKNIIEHLCAAQPRRLQEKNFARWWCKDESVQAAVKSFLSAPRLCFQLAASKLVYCALKTRSEVTFLRHQIHEIHKPNTVWAADFANVTGVQCHQDSVHN